MDRGLLQRKVSWPLAPSGCLLTLAGLLSGQLPEQVEGDLVVLLSDADADDLPPEIELLRPGDLPWFLSAVTASSGSREFVFFRY